MVLYTSILSTLQSLKDCETEKAFEKMFEKQHFSGNIHKSAERNRTLVTVVS